MTEPSLLASLRYRAKHAQSMIRRVELSGSDLDGLQSRLARGALLDLAEVAMPDVVLALLDERKVLHEQCAKAEAILRAMVAVADQYGVSSEPGLVAITSAREWLNTSVGLGVEPIEQDPERN